MAMTESVSDFFIQMNLLMKHFMTVAVSQFSEYLTALTQMHQLATMVLMQCNQALCVLKMMCQV